MAVSVPISFEFYPPKTDEQRTQLDRTAARLRSESPEYVSCTFGAGGSTLSYTPETVQRLREMHALDAAPHLSCMGGSREEIRQLLKLYRAMGCRRLVALRGDLPSGMARMGDLRHATDLVAFIRAEHGDWFHVEVGCYPECHPQADDALADLRHFKAKVDAGADYICTQLFFDNRDFHDFRERCELAGIRVPIIAGIMPITSLAGMKRMAQLAAGARFPAPLLRAVQRASHDPAEVERTGIEWATEQCRELLASHVRGIHFYTLNQSKATLAVYDNLCQSLPEPFGPRDPRPASVARQEFHPR